MSFENFRSTGPLKMERQEAEAIFNNRIVPERGAKGDRADIRTFYQVGGPPGSGKSTAIRQAELHSQGATQKIIPDDLAIYVPGYDDLASKQPQSASAYADEAGVGFFSAALMEYAAKVGANVILERAVPAGSDRNAKFFKGQGCRSELHVKATPRYQSWTGVYDRAEQALTNLHHIGTNFLVTKDAHEYCDEGWPRALFDAEHKRPLLYDRVVVETRDGTVIYDNELVRQADGTERWAKTPNGLQSLLSWRHLPVTDYDAQNTNAAWGRIVQNRHMKVGELSKLPLEQYQREVAKFVNSEGARVDPYEKSVVSEAARAEWYNNIMASMYSIVKTSRRDFGYSSEFEKQIEEYTNNLFGLAERNLSTGHSRERSRRPAESLLPRDGTNVRSVENGRRTIEKLDAESQKTRSSGTERSQLGQRLRTRESR